MGLMVDASMYDAPDPYVFDEGFQDVVVTLSMASRKFYDRVGFALEAMALDGEAAQWAIKACHAIREESGHGPGGVAVVLQRLNSWHDAGKITHEDVLAVRKLTVRAQTEGLPPDDAAISELASILRRRMERAAISDASRAYGQRQGDYSTVVDQLDKAKQLGKADTDLGMRAMLDTSDLDALLTGRKLSTGIPEVDNALRGGYHPASLTAWLAPAGGGKSFALVQQAVASIRAGHPVTVVGTAELPAPIVDARIKCGLTGYPLTAYLEGDRQKCLEQLEKMLPGVGCWYVKYFEPNGTTTADVFRWVTAVEDREGAAAPVLVFDYADKLGVTSDNEYKAMRGVYDSLRDWAVGNGKWVITASQSTRVKQGSGQLIGLNNFADSMHKPRIADVCISINEQEDENSNLLYVCKNRNGEGGQRIGPLPKRYAFGMLADPSGTPVEETESLEAQIAILREAGVKPKL
jgi:hypothetical protein